MGKEVDLYMTGVDISVGVGERLGEECKLCGIVNLTG